MAQVFSLQCLPLGDCQNGGATNEERREKISTGTECVGIWGIVVAKPNHLVMSRYLEKEAMCMGINSYPFITSLRPQV